MHSVALCLDPTGDCISVAFRGCRCSRCTRRTGVHLVNLCGSRLLRLLASPLRLLRLLTPAAPCVSSRLLRILLLQNADLLDVNEGRSLTLACEIFAAILPRSGRFEPTMLNDICTATTVLDDGAL